MPSSPQRMCANRNPFASRWVRPGAIPFRFNEGESLERLAARLSQFGGRGQIVGPHGSGKSTLVRQCRAYLSKDHACRFMRFSSADRMTRHRWRDMIRDTVAEGMRTGQQPLLIIDGFEQLAPWPRYWLRRASRLGECGLLVTCHHDAGLPTLTTTMVDRDIASYVIAQLLRNPHCGTPEWPASVTEDALDRMLARHRGNLREVIFELYDRY